MCATCHDKTDPAFPTDLKLGKKCKDCHGAAENIPATWKIKGEPRVRIGSLRVAEGPKSAAVKVEANLRWMLEKRGFVAARDGETAQAHVTMQIRIWRVREDRFVARDELVMRASLVAEVREGAGGKVLFRKRVLSRPEYGRDPAEVGTAVARDAFEILSGFLARALKKVTKGEVVEAPK
ncbi:MAG: hypothetical protein ACYTHM_20280 [Planctomycetota bacterium]|jgi:hypothetical protein